MEDITEKTVIAAEIICASCGSGPNVCTTCPVKNLLETLPPKDVEAPIGNYYGVPLCRKTGEGKYLFILENWDGEHEVEVSEEFYNAWCKEFGGKP